MTRLWLVTPEALAEYTVHARSGKLPTPEQLAILTAARAESRNAGVKPDLVAVDGDVAVIGVVGLLTRDYDWIADLFFGGNTTYADIGTGLAWAESEPAVRSIRLAIDSPGGEVAGLIPTLDLLASLSKPVSAMVYECACSAAYGLAAATGRIEAAHEAALVGSVGVAIDTYVSASRVSVTNTESPNKRPDPRTEEGRAVMRRHLDALHEVFVGHISRGRGTTAKNVIRNYGRGDVLIARDALAAGMIDHIVASRRSTRRAARGGESAMTSAEMRARHPELVEEIEKAATAAERARCVGHLDLATRSGARELAEAAIREGTPPDVAAVTAHMDAARNRHDINERQLELDEAAEATRGTYPAGRVEYGDSFASRVADRIRAGRSEVV